jgi:hypothetical protein
MPPPYQASTTPERDPERDNHRASDVFADAWESPTADTYRTAIQAAVRWVIYYTERGPSHRLRIARLIVAHLEERLAEYERYSTEASSADRRTVEVRVDGPVE